MIRTLLTSLALAHALSAAYVRADVPPPDDYKERCTLERTCPSGKECVLCPANFSERDGCSEQLREHGFSMSCQSWGASVWNEIWCRDIPEDDASTASLTAPGTGDPLTIKRCTGSSDSDSDSDCSCRAPGTQGKSDHSHYPLTGVAAAIVLLFTFARRRRSR